MIVIALVLVGGFWPSTARAQHCHVPVPLEGADPDLKLMVGAEFATFRTSRYEGSYQGLNVGGLWEHRRVQLRASLPAYRLTRNGLDADGLGDLAVSVRVPLLRADGDGFLGGLQLKATAPTGDAGRDLGMGHVMLMSGVWASWRSNRIFLAAEVVYGRSLGEHGGHHAAAVPGPLVNPMNPSEIEAAASGGVRLHDRVRVRTGAYGAAPIAVTGGSARGVAFVGADLLVDWFDLGVEAFVPFVGDPFIGKVLLTASARL